MDLYTLRDLKKKSHSLSQNELSDFEERMDYGVHSAELYDVFLSHPGLSTPLLCTIEGEFRKRGFSVLTLTGRNGKNGTFSSAVKKIFPRCNALVITDLYEKNFTWQDYHQIGYFSCLKNRIAVLPILKKDVNTDTYQGRGIFAHYPYLGSGVVFMENRETYWVMRNPDSYVDFEYWLSADPEYIDW